MRPLHRRRVAVHEAGHAVMAVANRFRLGGCFLTTTISSSQGGLGGYTHWGNPLAGRQNLQSLSYQIHGPGVVMTLLAGQEAEKLLAESRPELRLDPMCRDWALDNSEAERFLTAMGQLQALDDYRRATAATLRRLQRAVFGVADDLVVPNDSQVDPTAGLPLQCGVTLVPDGPVVDATRVAYWLRTVEVAEVAYLHWIDRGCLHGGDASDWDYAESRVPSL